MILLLPGAHLKSEMPVTTSYPIPAGKGDALRAQAGWAWEDGHPGERKTNYPNSKENGNSIKERGAEGGKPLSNTGECFPCLTTSTSLPGSQTLGEKTSFPKLQF